MSVEHAVDRTEAPSTRWPESGLKSVVLRLETAKCRSAVTHILGSSHAQVIRNSTCVQDSGGVISRHIGRFIPLEWEWQTPLPFSFKHRRFVVDKRNGSSRALARTPSMPDRKFAPEIKPPPQRPERKLCGEMLNARGIRQKPRRGLHQNECCGHGNRPAPDRADSCILRSRGGGVRRNRPQHEGQ
jgi:hypothetical protein